ncbi:MgtC/SapB family protein [Geobacter pelophilus]|uniref:MgtC/SapB family protein n=1 Tax=Geoanaerobacter pelophilus TaxID=60036 RepID=A0AAW4KYS0_9BACT|nr:MgtC/SapB family protein [Geoanaerobacter pelophilus]MBT0662685.1 MgtC/SapB family protein [Geoanaerobacter pelophilus]
MAIELSLDIAVKLMLASILGGIIGLEREVHGRPAGFRTHLLVSLGSCLFVITSVSFYLKFGNLTGQGPLGVDPSRVAAQVVTGIGFLGAGAIIREKASIRGLTTAACLWVAAAVGVAVGVGMYSTSVLVTSLAVLNLVFLKKLENRLKKDTYFRIIVWTDDLEGQTTRVEQMLTACKMEIVTLVIEKDLAQKSVLLEIDVKSRSREECGRLTDQLSLLEGVTKIRLE